MGNYEDLYWEIDAKLEELELKEDFQKQLLKMRNQDKHKYKSFREMYEYAFSRVTKSTLPYNP